VASSVQLSRDHQVFRHELSARVTAAQGSLTTNDNQVAEYLQSHLAELPFETADSISAGVGVSRAAVVRLAHKLGYPGFAALRDASRRQFQPGARSPLARFSSMEAVGEPSDQVSHAKFIADRHNLEATWSMIGSQLQVAARDVALARQVYVGGNGNSYGLASYLHCLLHGVRSGTHLLTPGLPDEAVDLTSDHALVMCLFRRYFATSVRTLERVTRSGAKTVAITDGRSYPFLRGVTHVLAVNTDSPTLFQSMVAVVATLEAFAAHVAEVIPVETTRVLDARERIAVEESSFYRAPNRRSVTHAAQRAGG